MIRAAQMEEYNNNGKMHPKKFSLVLLIVGMTMLFLGLTSAFLVREAEGNWLHFSLPPQFVGSTVAVVISSLSMYLCLLFSEKRQPKKCHNRHGSDACCWFEFCLFPILRIQRHGR